MLSVRLEDVTKRFGDVIATDHVSLHVNPGEFFTLLGPSGCGKTTVLRTIAGFYRSGGSGPNRLDEGRVYFGEQDVTSLEPYERNSSMVFQDYALWPHMNVFDNVSYGLKIRKIGRDETEKRVSNTLRLVGLEGLGKRIPSELSGGQRQRVALARALVVEPDVFLLDEPLSNLDAKERVRVRSEIRRIQRELKITSIYVTHDQEEALCISDRIAVLYQGKLQQIGAPMEIYKKPEKAFVADFLGFEGPVLDGEIKGKKVYLKDIDQHLTFEKVKERYPSRVKAIIKPNDVEIHEDRKGDFLVKDTIFLGPTISYEVQVHDGKIIKVLEKYVKTKKHIEKGKRVRLKIHEPIRVFG